MALDFSTGLREVWQWMDDKEVDLDMMSMPSEDAGTLQQQIDQHKVSVNITVLHSIRGDRTTYAPI